MRAFPDDILVMSGKKLSLLNPIRALDDIQSTDEQPRRMRSSTLLLTLLKDFDDLLGSLDTTECHGAEGRSHTVGTVDFREFHAADDEAGDDLAGALDDGVFGGVHVEAAHAAKALDGLHADEALDGEGTEGAVVTGGGDDDGGVDGVSIEASRILNGSGIEELDVGELQDLAEQSAGEESSVLDDNVVAVIAVLLVVDANLAEEGISRLAHDHGREELATEPGTTTRADTGLDDGNLEVRTSLGQAVCGRETARASANDDNVRLGILVQVGEVAAGHGSADLRLTDGAEGEGLPVTGHSLNGLALGLPSNRDSRAVRKVHLLRRNGRRDRLVEQHGWGRHCGMIGSRFGKSVAGQNMPWRHKKGNQVQAV
ncbi:Thi4-domain-containing protein, partial [Aureobasidium melanogenum]